MSVKKKISMLIESEEGEKSSRVAPRRVVARHKASQTEGNCRHKIQPLANGKHSLRHGQEMM